jgi:hypothetical protein
MFSLAEMQLKNKNISPYMRGLNIMIGTHSQPQVISFTEPLWIRRQFGHEL